MKFRPTLNSTPVVLLAIAAVVPHVNTHCPFAVFCRIVLLPTSGTCCDKLSKGNVHGFTTAHCVVAAKCDWLNIRCFRTALIRPTGVCYGTLSMGFVHGLSTAYLVLAVDMH